ncbi:MULTISPECIES: hypothetical protein [Pseudomonas]|uniref:hypothetical protein n=1 Tax=Pseudomonas TaxID=286 RepID=UPI00070A2C57|nr:MULTISPECIES: hypothetical protein [Pseudomonas]WIN05610.1 hypothetical protein QQF68_18625 [Pseudomonas syringae pv. antirrhini str. 126]
MERKITFCYQAITDIQTTIRAIDTKIGFLMVAIFIPTAGVKEISSVYRATAAHSDCLAILMWITAAAWAVTLIVLFRALWSVKNPAANVTGSDAHGVFFHSANYKMGPAACFFNYPVKSKISLQEAITRIPSDEQGLIKELVFEKMKLEYIRDIKMRRCSMSSVLTLFWMATGVGIYAYSLMSKY